MKFLNETRRPRVRGLRNNTIWKMKMRGIFDFDHFSEQKMMERYSRKAQGYHTSPSTTNILLHGPVVRLDTCDVLDVEKNFKIQNFYCGHFHKNSIPSEVKKISYP